jgi:hypothetical protein
MAHQTISIKNPKLYLFGFTVADWALRIWRGHLIRIALALQKVQSGLSGNGIKIWPPRIQTANRESALTFDDNQIVYCRSLSVTPRLER